MAETAALKEKIDKLKTQLSHADDENRVGRRKRLKRAQRKMRFLEGKKKKVRREE